MPVLDDTYIVRNEQALHHSTTTLYKNYHSRTTQGSLSDEPVSSASTILKMKSTRRASPMLCKVMHDLQSVEYLNNAIGKMIR